MNHWRARATRGYTLIEVLVAMTLTGIVVAGTLRALTAQKKFYARQTRILDARHAMRASMTILTSELRDVSASGGDLYAIASDSVVFRSTSGFAIVCGVGSGKLSVRNVSGHFNFIDMEDSLLVHVENTEREDDDTWSAHYVGLITGWGLPDCAFGGSPDRVITVGGDLSGIWVGAPARLFHAYVFGLFSMDDRWWLGRRLVWAESQYVPVAGPLAPPDSGGLQLQYFRADGQPTTDPGSVVRVSITVRAPAHRSLVEPDYRSLRTSVYLRN
jgi:prepilin-type N-terminal cleavage/methylation domain-containing protein